MTIEQLRTAIKQQRAALSASEINQASQAIAAQLIVHPYYQNAENLACYVAHQGEINPKFIWEQAWQDHKNVFLPVLDATRDKHLQFVRYRAGDELIKNRFGILEPDINQQDTIVATELDLIIMPLVAFDSHGHRIGMGSGYYDRTLAFMQQRPATPKLIGIAYDFQQIETISPTQWDIPLDNVITPSNLK